MRLAAILLAAVLAGCASASDPEGTMGEDTAPQDPAAPKPSLDVPPALAPEEVRSGATGPEAGLPDPISWGGATDSRHCLLLPVGCAGWTTFSATDEVELDMGRGARGLELNLTWERQNPQTGSLRLSANWNGGSRALEGPSPLVLDVEDPYGPILLKVEVVHPAPPALLGYDPQPFHVAGTFR